MSMTAGRSVRVAVGLAALLCAASAAAAAELRFSSAERRGTVIELYTSEGCSSCPPAEAYLNAYLEREGLWTRYIPLAFHVDYWDRLGWRDRFAQPAHARRQRRYAQLHHAPTVYTPAFLVNGRAWRPRLFGGTPSRTNAAAGALRVVVDGETVTGRFQPLRGRSGPLTFHVALLGMGLTTNIAAGENAGRRARHEFVVLGLAATGTRRGGEWRLPLPGATAEGARGYALAAWVSAGEDPTPIQATGHALPRGLWPH